MITLTIIEYLISLFIIPFMIVSVYYLNKVGFFHDEEEVRQFKFITLQADEGKRED